MRKKKIVTIGGGTGSFTLLNGLKKYPVELSAIVSMADDGGSTGVLRDELGVLPPGDVRQCLVALSQSSHVMRELMNYRFEQGGLQGHNFGNLFLSALEKISGGFGQGIEEAMSILNVQGEVIPVTNEDAKLELILKNGDVLHGENEINHSEAIQAHGVRKFMFSQPVRANAKALRRIQQADSIIIGPGNLYCSLLPNLIIKEIAMAIKKSKARVVYVCNLTNKKGHTMDWDVQDYVTAIENYIGAGRVDYVIYNNKKPSKQLVERYEKMEGKNALVAFHDSSEIRRTYKVVRANVVSRKIPIINAHDAVAETRAFIRHDSNALAKVITFLLTMNENNTIIHDIV